MKLVLLHAFPLDERMWEPQLEALSDHETFTCALEVFKGAGHLLTVEQPERFNELLLGFLADRDLGLR
jgi:pimeloyl-ACP methyl ester carboxylesterase